MINATSDLYRGFIQYRIWFGFAWLDVRQRYRSSILGPFWIIISTALMIGFMGPLYSKLFNQEPNKYLIYLTIGIIYWQLIVSLLTDAGQVFISSEQYIKQLNIPYSIYVFRSVCKNFIIFLHSLTILIIIIFISDYAININIIYVPLGIFLILVNGFFAGLFLGILSSRFRDIQQIVVNLLQITFFITPIMWDKSMLGAKSWLVNFNPIYHLIEIVRAPLMGNDIALLSLILSIGFTLFMLILSFVIFAKYRDNIPYWI